MFNKKVSKKAQIVMEFMLLIALAFCIVIGLLATVYTVLKGNSKIQSYAEMDDLGKALQQEFLLASKLEDGYTRKINLPMTVGHAQYTALVGQSDPQNSYLILDYEGTELFYMIPPINGTIRLGDNTLRKINNTLKLN